MHIFVLYCIVFTIKFTNKLRRKLNLKKTANYKIILDLTSVVGTLCELRLFNLKQNNYAVCLSARRTLNFFIVL